MKTLDIERWKSDLRAELNQAVGVAAVDAKWWQLNIVLDTHVAWIRQKKCYELMAAVTFLIFVPMACITLPNVPNPFSEYTSYPVVGGMSLSQRSTKNPTHKLRIPLDSISFFFVMGITLLPRIFGHFCPDFSKTTDLIQVQDLTRFTYFRENTLLQDDATLANAKLGRFLGEVEQINERIELEISEHWGNRSGAALIAFGLGVIFEILYYGLQAPLAVTVQPSVAARATIQLFVRCMTLAIYTSMMRLVYPETGIFSASSIWRKALPSRHPDDEGNPHSAPANTVPR